MKKLVSFLFVLLIILSSLFFVHAHSGKTDSNGGHNSSSGYHYHHGYPAHQHKNGECPYDFDDKTGSNSGSSSSSSSSSKSTTNSGTSNSIPSFFDTLKQQTMERELEEYKSLSNNRLIYIVCLFIILVFLIVILIHNNNKKNKAQEEANKHKRNLETEIEKLKKEKESYENELYYHSILKNIIENTQKNKHTLCGTPFLIAEQKRKEQYNSELQANYKLRYHCHPHYIDTNKMVTEILGTEVTYTYDFLIERCFKYIYSYDNAFFPKEDIIVEFQTFLSSWLRYYPQLINTVDDESLPLFVLIILTKNLLLKGISKPGICGLYKYRNDNSLTFGGQSLKSFMIYCYEELFFLDKITEKKLKLFIYKIEETFPDTIK